MSGVIQPVLQVFTKWGPLDGMFDPSVIPGPRLGELAEQTSKEGVPRPIVFGIARPIGGNVIATTKPIIRRKKQSSGKGGGTETEVETVSRTYAIRVCEGPINGYRRIWRNGKLVYDASSSSDTAADNREQFLKLATLYSGRYSQNPDPVLQAAFGVSSVVAHRGTAYIVIDNEDLTDLGGAIPRYTFEVVRGEGWYLTSRPYNISVTDGILMDGVDSVRPHPEHMLPPEGIDMGGVTALSGVLREPLNIYDNAIPEGIEMGGVTALSGVLDVVLISYDNAIPEGIEMGGVTALSGSLDVVLISYDNAIPEGIDMSGVTALSGSLTVI